MVPIIITARNRPKPMNLWINLSSVFFFFCMMTLANLNRSSFVKKYKNAIEAEPAKTVGKVRARAKFLLKTKVMNNKRLKRMYTIRIIRALT